MASRNFNPFRLWFLPKNKLDNGTEDTTYTISEADLLQGYVDVDGDCLHVSDLSSSAGNLINQGDGTWTLTPPQDFNGQINLAYNVSDGNGGNTSATQSFFLDAVNDAPILNQLIKYTLNSSDLLEGFTDPDGDKLSISELSSSTGFIQENSQDIYTLITPIDFNGSVQLDYKVIDGNGGSTSSSLSFALDNRRELANGIEDQDYLLNSSDLMKGFTDPDGDKLFISDLSSSVGDLIKQGDGSWTLTPPQDFNGQINLAYNVMDENGGSTSATQAFTLDAVNDAPIAPENKPVIKVDYDQNSLYSLEGIKDFDGNLHGGMEKEVVNNYKFQGVIDVNNDEKREMIFTNDQSGRWVTVETCPITGEIDYNKHGQDGITRVVGIYDDPLIKEGEENNGYLLSGEIAPTRGSDHDSQKRFQKDLLSDNLSLIFAEDIDNDGFQEVIWKTNDGSAFLRALMHDDGNLQYANYQSEEQLTSYLDSHSFNDTSLQTI